MNLLKGGMSLEQIINLLYDDMDTADDSLVEEYGNIGRKELNIIVIVILIDSKEEL